MPASPTSSNSRCAPCADFRWGMPRAHYAAVMVNLLGDLVAAAREPDWSQRCWPSRGLKLHLYGKHHARAGPQDGPLHGDRRRCRTHHRGRAGGTRRIGIATEPVGGRARRIGSAHLLKRLSPSRRRRSSICATKSRRRSHCCGSGELVAFPTETVYGLGADALNVRGGGKNLCRQGAARRPPADRASAAGTRSSSTGRATCRRRAQRPCGYLLARAADPDPQAPAPHSRHRHRRPGHRRPARAGSPGRARTAGRISAAASPRPRPTASAASARPRPSMCAQELGDRVPLMLDGGPCASASNRPSSIFPAAAPRILRPGAIGAAADRGGARRAGARARRRRGDARVSGSPARPLRAAHPAAAGPGATAALPRPSPASSQGLTRRGTGTRGTSRTSAEP